MPIRLTEEERRAIMILKRLENKWPKTLWLFSASGTLYVMKKDAEGEKAHHPGLEGGVDQAFIAATIEIENDGGDW